MMVPGQPAVFPIDLAYKEYDGFMESVVAAAVGVLGVVGGAILQYWLSHRTSLVSRRSEQVTRAYADFLLGVAGVVQAQRHKDPNALREGLKQVTDAKVRLAVYGEPQVIHAVASFDRLGGRIESTEEKQAFVSIVLAMRGNGESPIAQDDLMAVIFGKG